MNEKCKYCDYAPECSRICEYDSILCKARRSFPKVVDKSYEQLQQENQQLQEIIKKVYEILDNFEAYLEPQDTLKIIKCKELLKTKELEKGSDNNG